MGIYIYFYIFIFLIFMACYPLFLPLLSFVLIHFLKCKILFLHINSIILTGALIFSEDGTAMLKSISLNMEKTNISVSSHKQKDELLLRQKQDCFPEKHKTSPEPKQVTSTIDQLSDEDISEMDEYIPKVS